MHAIKRIHLVKMRLPFDGVNTYLRISSFGDNLEFAFFGAPTSVGALFICLMEGRMNENIPEKVMDISGVELTPGKPAVFLKNGGIFSKNYDFFAKLKVNVRFFAYLM